MSPFSLLAVAIISTAIILSLARRIPFSLMMAAVIAAVFGIKVLESPLVLSPMTLDLAFQPAHLSSPPHLYTLFTSMFLHSSFFHLIFNMIALIFLGPLLEEKIGVAKFAVIYVTAGIIGTLAFGVIHLNEVAIVLGASGAISGVLGAFAALYPREKIAMLYMFIPLPQMRVPYLVAIIVLIETLLAFDPSTHTAHEAHLAGLAAGMLFGPLVMRISPAERAEPLHALQGLEELAVTDELKAILGRLKGESVEDVRRAWLERFIRKSRCPNCDGSLRLKGRRVSCDCGWSTRIEGKK